MGARGAVLVQVLALAVLLALPATGYSSATSRDASSATRVDSSATGPQLLATCSGTAPQNGVGGGHVLCDPGISVPAGGVFVATIVDFSSFAPSSDNGITCPVFRSLPVTSNLSPAVWGLTCAGSPFGPQVAYSFFGGSDTYCSLYANNCFLQVFGFVFSGAVLPVPRLVGAGSHVFRGASATDPIGGSSPAAPGADALVLVSSTNDPAFPQCTFNVAPAFSRVLSTPSAFNVTQSLNSRAGLAWISGNFTDAADTLIPQCEGNNERSTLLAFTVSASPAPPSPVGGGNPPPGFVFPTGIQQVGVAAINYWQLEVLGAVLVGVVIGILRLRSLGPDRSRG